MTLTKIAKQMKEEAKTRGFSHRTLELGLKLSLFEREKDIVLSISRPSALVCPSEGEIDFYRRLFFGDTPLKVVNGETFIWSHRKCFIAVEKEII